MVALGSLPFIYAFIIPVPFEYKGIPFQVCPIGYAGSVETCQGYSSVPVFHPNDVVPVVVTRCIEDRFARGTEVAYVISRNVANTSNGTRVILPDIATAASPIGGCETVLTLIHQLPDSIVPGPYQLEGVATVYGRFRTVNAYFQTVPFLVETKGSQ